MAKENMVLIHKTGVSGLNPPANVKETHPWLIEGDLSPPQFMVMEFIGLRGGGSERFGVRGKTKEDIVEFLLANRFTLHPRLLTLTITGPDFSLKLKKGDELPSNFGVPTKITSEAQ